MAKRLLSIQDAQQYPTTEAYKKSSLPLPATNKSTIFYPFGTETVMSGAAVLHRVFSLLLATAWLTTPLAADTTAEATIMALAKQATAIPSEPAKTSFHPVTGITDLILPNGLRVVLKPMPESDETLLHMFADGGSTAFPLDQKAEAKYCGTFAIESGLPNVSVEALWDFNFKYSVEIAVRTRPFQRKVECTVPSAYVAQALAVVHHLFLDAEVTEPGIARVLQSTVDAVRYRAVDCDFQFEDLYLALNSGGHPLLLPTSAEQLNNISYEDAQAAFIRSFRNPSQFTMVIVGDFTIDSILPTVLRYLGTIPEAPSDTLWPGPDIRLRFPSQRIEKSLRCGMQEETLSRITSLVTLPLTQTNIHAFEIATQILESRLRSTLNKHTTASFGVDVQYHFPLFPRIAPVWLTVQFRCPRERISEVEKLCIEEMRTLQENPPSAEEMLAVQTLIHRVDAFWLQQNSYWLQTLSNYLQWNWTPDCVADGCHVVDTITPETIHNILRQSYSTESYTLLNLDSKE